jgi:hypothetical protein
MKRKLVYLPSTYYSKDIVDDINSYFDKGYNIEGILDADTGFYLVLILDNNEEYKYTGLKKLDSYFPYDKLKLIEENISFTSSEFPQHHWTSTNTEDIKPN